MNRAIGRLIGLILSLLVIAAGLIASYFMVTILAQPGAHDIVEWLLLSIGVTGFGLGLAMLATWIEIDARREGSWLS